MHDFNMFEEFKVVLAEINDKPVVVYPSTFKRLVSLENGINDFYRTAAKSTKPCNTAIQYFAKLISDLTARPFLIGDEWQWERVFSKEEIEKSFPVKQRWLRKFGQLLKVE